MEIADEFEGIDLGDRRLNERAVRVIETLSRQPMASINAACGGLSETTAAYRLFDNKKVAPETVDDILRVIVYYGARWTIESYFRVLNSGCTIEELQLETTPRVWRCLMLYRIIAWRAIHLTYLGRECPELPCDMIFADHEWKPVWQIVKQNRRPASANSSKCWPPSAAITPTNATAPPAPKPSGSPSAA